MRYSVALTKAVHDELCRRLLRTDGQEDVSFCIWHPSKGRARYSALITEMIAPNPGDRLIHGNVDVMPQYVSRAKAYAVERGAGLAILHSHPGPGWQPMSADDWATESKLAPPVQGSTHLPLVGLTLGSDGAWSARFWIKTGPRRYEPKWCESVRVVGEGLRVTFNDELLPAEGYRPELARTVSAWGNDAQAVLARLHVGVVGLGSVGSMVAEALARMGIQRLTLLDFDRIEQVNLDRHMHAVSEDVGQAKVSVVKRELLRRATAAKFDVGAYQWSIAEPEGFRVALDCDVLFCCVDNRPWARHVLNSIAYAHLIPVIDGGVRARPLHNQRGLCRADVRGHVAMPGTACLECLGQYDSGLVSADKAGLLDSADYIEGLPEDHVLRQNQNVFAFSMMAATLELRQLIAMVAASHFLYPQQMYHFVTAGLDRGSAQCQPRCYFLGISGLGDHCPESVTGRHEVAERMRGQ